MAGEGEIILKKLDILAEKGLEFKNKNLKELNLERSDIKISQRQFEMLGALEHLEINTISELAKLMHLSKSTLSILMSKLQKKGYVYKELPGNTGDGRRVYFKVTENGKKVLDEKSKIHMEELQHYYNALSTEQKENFKKGVACFRQVAEDEQNLYKIIMNKKELRSQYGDDVVTVAEDFAYFFVSILMRNAEQYDPAMCLSEELKDITGNQVNLLINIDKLGLDTISKLEGRLNSSGSTLSITISKMVDKGYLYKEYPTSEQDGRVVYIRLTEHGRKIMNEIQLKAKEKMLNFIKGLDCDKLKTFNDGIDYLLQVFDEN